MKCRCVFVLVIVAVASALDQDAEESIQDIVRTLKGQVSALLERRQEDYRLLERSLRQSLEKSSELASLKEELEKIRHDVLTSNGRNNEHLTAQWVTSSMSQLRAEVAELARAHNDSVDQAARSDLRRQWRLARQDSAALRKELDRLRVDHGRTDARLTQALQDVSALRAQQQGAAEKASHYAHQVLTLQSELQTLKKSFKKNPTSSTPSVSTNPADDGEDNRLPVHRLNEDSMGLEHDAPLRHHHMVKAQVAQLTASTRALKEDHEQLRRQMRHLDKSVRIAIKLRRERVADNGAIETSEVLSRMDALENSTRIMSTSVHNVSRQILGLAALRGSTLQLLESLEALESKVDSSVPAVQREISRLEFTMAQVRAVANENKEDLSNQRASLKAMAASISNLQDRTAADHTLLTVMEQQIVNASLRQGAMELAIGFLNHQSKPAGANPVEAEPVAQIADDPALPHLVDELNHVQQEYEGILHKLPRDCSSVRGGSGEYLVSAGEGGAPLLVTCDQRTQNGGWTVIQRREDGSQDFNRTWEDYAKGFGALTGEFWLGNSALHRLTEDGCMKLRVELEDIYEQRWIAEYDHFVIGSKENGYKLVVDGYTGNASDALSYHTKMEFSAPNRDRDNSSTHCAQNYGGGWWFSHCQHANLNGRYNLGLTWFQASRNEWIAVARSELKIKRNVEKEGCSHLHMEHDAPSSTTVSTTRQSLSLEKNTRSTNIML